MAKDDGKTGKKSQTGSKKPAGAAKGEVVAKKVAKASAKSEAAHVADDKVVAARDHHDDHGDHDHAHAHKDAAHGAPGAHAVAGHGSGHKVNRREYWIVFFVLAALTVIEVLVAQIPGIGKTALYVAMIGLALAKAAIVGLFYMHLKHETKIMKWSVALPFAAPALYAVVLIAEGAWRLNR